MKARERVYKLIPRQKHIAMHGKSSKSLKLTEKCFDVLQLDQCLMPVLEWSALHIIIIIKVFFDDF